MDYDVWGRWIISARDGGKVYARWKRGMRALNDLSAVKTIYARSERFISGESDL